MSWDGVTVKTPQKFWPAANRPEYFFGAECWRCHQSATKRRIFSVGGNSSVLVCDRCGAPEFKPIQAEDWVGAA